MIALLFALALQMTASASAPSSLVSLLRAKDQALLDAVAVGDRATWERSLTPEAFYVDENGQVMTRAQLLADLRPLPAGVSGKISIVDYQVRLVGDTALVVHRDEERENYHGQQLAATYLTTATWVRRRGEWRLAMVHVFAVNNVPPAIAIPESKLEEYVGRYSAAPDLFWIIRREGDHLVGGREGRESHPLLAELEDVMFVPGQPRVRILFQRNQRGRITGFLNRREGEDIHWTRIN